MWRARTVPIVVIVWLMTGCAARDPLEQTVSVPTPGRFAAWRAQVASDSGIETRRRVEEALQEIRLNVAGERELQRTMGEKVVGGSEAIDEAVRQRVHGRRLVEVLQLGYELRVRRLLEELAGLEDAMSKNAQLVTRPGDLESKHHLEGLQERQRVRVVKYRDDLAAAEKELSPLRARTGKTMLEVSAEASGGKSGPTAQLPEKRSE